MIVYLMVSQKCDYKQERLTNCSRRRLLERGFSADSRTGLKLLVETHSSTPPDTPASERFTHYPAEICGY